MLTDWEREFATSIAGRWRLIAMQQAGLIRLQRNCADCSCEGYCSVRFSLFPDRFGFTVYLQEANAEELAEHIRGAVRATKDALPLVKFATFGDARTKEKCLRHDANVQTITGVEADYDGGEISFERAVEIAEKARLKAIVYTSPSYTTEKPRWRVLCPLSAEMAPDMRDRMMARLSGLYQGVFAPESWALSQAYYVGRTADGAAPLVEPVDGMCIDELDELDEIAIGKPNGIRANGNGSINDPFDEEALLNAIASGESYHRAALSLLGHWASHGVGMLEAKQNLVMAFESVFPPDRDGRWHDRYNEIDKLVGYVYGKQADKLDERVEFVVRSTSDGATVEEPEADPSPPARPIEDWPEPLGLAAYHGLAGEVVCAIEPYTEADPAAILFQFLAACGNVFGRRAYFLVEDTRHHPNLFTLLVGNTSKARKGTSWRRIRRLFEETSWVNDCLCGGLSTGEGLIHRVRDRVIEAQYDKKTRKTHDVVVDPGVDDKRLLVIEEEFARPLRAMMRPENILSAVLREAWDGDQLQVMTKKSPQKATGAHISVIAHITRDDLLENMDMTSTANGFGNRLMFCCIRRSKTLPFGGRGGDQVIPPIRARLLEAINHCPIGELRFDHEAEELWREKYDELSAERLGMYGAITARGEAQVIRIALLYALLDQKQFIGAPHLEAALEVWRYADASARSIFGDKVGDRIADSILAALRRAGGAGMTRTQIRELLGNSIPASRIDAALAKLASQKLARGVTRNSTGGRSVTTWYL